MSGSITYFKRKERRHGKAASRKMTKERFHRSQLCGNSFNKDARITLSARFPNYLSCGPTGSPRAQRLKTLEPSTARLIVNCGSRSIYARAADCDPGECHCRYSGGLRL